MAKALIGHLPAQLRGARQGTSDVIRLRARVAELEELVVRLQRENDELAAAAVDTVVAEPGTLQPA